MINNLKKLVIDLMPPILWRFCQRSIKGSGYFGDYPDWQSAKRASSGYDADLILEKVRGALLKVKNGEAVYERDSVLFDEVHYSWPLLAGLLWVASLKGNRLNLLDFGGSLGSSYFQNRHFLAHLQEFSWSIVEQEKFVRCGKENFEDQRLKFYYTIDECINCQHPDVVLLSSVLPYLEKPYELLTEITFSGFEYIIIDRTPLLEGDMDRLTVQKVPAEIYPARYPAWILSQQKILAHVKREYELVAEFDALAGMVDLDDIKARDKGFVFRKRSRNLSSSNV